MGWCSSNLCSADTHTVSILVRAIGYPERVYVFFYGRPCKFRDATYVALSYTVFSTISKYSTLYSLRIVRRKCLLTHVIEGKVEGRSDGKTRKKR